MLIYLSPIMSPEYCEMSLVFRMLKQILFKPLSEARSAGPLAFGRLVSILRSSNDLKLVVKGQEYKWSRPFGEGIPMDQASLAVVVKNHAVPP